MCRAGMGYCYGGGQFHNDLLGYAIIAAFIIGCLLVAWYMAKRL
jgi:hypothetical protein